ncbi:MAG: GNAT family N-acetyltransferase [Mycobacteriales bacterium]
MRPDPDAQARQSAERAGIEVRPVRTPGQTADVHRVFTAIWGGEPIDLASIVALAKTGNYVFGGYDGGELVAASLAFFGTPLGANLHSHVTGVLPAHEGRGIGRALKWHQRAWCLARGITHVTWTFDPLIARNAWVNIHRLGADVSEYAVDLYGPITDARNAGPTDRLLLRWDLRDPGPRRADGETRSVAVPPDIEAMRRTEPAAARRWQLDLRDTLGTALVDGWRVVDFARSGQYLLKRT